VGEIKSLYQKRFHVPEVEPGRWEIKMHKPNISVGGGQSADINIEGIGAEFRITKEGEKWGIILASDNTVRINVFFVLEVGMTRYLRSGDKINTGLHEFEFQVEGERAYLKLISSPATFVVERLQRRGPRLFRNGNFFMNDCQSLTLQTIKKWNGVRLGREAGGDNGIWTLNVAKAGLMGSRKYGVIKPNGTSFILTVIDAVFDKKTVSVRSSAGDPKPAEEKKITLEAGDEIFVAEQKIMTFHPQDPTES
jgi:hypothetical protein